MVEWGGDDVLGLGWVRTVGLSCGVGGRWMDGEEEGREEDRGGEGRGGRGEERRG